MALEFDDSEQLTASLIQQAEATFPDYSVEPLGLGSFNCVVRAGEYALKSPLVSDREEKVAFVEAEAAILDKLPAVADLPNGTILHLPALKESKPGDPVPHNIFRFVPGTILSMPDVIAFDGADKAQLGRDIGSFVAWLSGVLTVDPSKEQPTKAPISSKTIVTALREYRLPFTEMMRSNGFQSTATLIEELVGGKQFDEGGTVYHAYILGHGDLRPANLTFNGNRLYGVFDFGNAVVTDPAEQLRWMYLLGESAGYAATQQYNEQTNSQVSLERVAKYAAIQVMSAAGRVAMHPSGRSLPTFQKDFLTSRYPEYDWSELG